LVILPFGRDGKPRKGTSPGEGGKILEIKGADVVG
jgi:hypothetical protein